MTHDDAAAICEHLAARAPGVVQLAEAVSLAARVEPALLRSMRLALFPKLEPGVESDLWFSSLVEVSGARAMTFRPPVLHVLRQRLLRDHAAGARARAIVARVHLQSPPIAQLEEEVTWEALAGDFGKAETQLQRLLKRMLGATHAQGSRGDALALGRWVLRAWPRLPVKLRERDVGQDLLFAASATAGVRAAGLATGRRKLPAGWALPDRFATTEIGVLYDPSGLRFVETGGARLPLPDTNPSVVEVGWRVGETTGTTLAEAASGNVVELPAGASGLTLRTLSGHVYGLGDDLHWSALRVLDDAQALHASCVTLGDRTGYFVTSDLIATVTHAGEEQLPGVVQLEWFGKRLNGRTVAIEGFANCAIVKLDDAQPLARVVTLAGPSPRGATRRRNWISARGIGGIIDWPPDSHEHFTIVEPMRTVVVFGWRGEAGAAAELTRTLASHGYQVLDGEAEWESDGMPCDAVIFVVSEPLSAWPQWVVERARNEFTFPVIVISSEPTEGTALPPEFVVTRDEVGAYRILRASLAPSRDTLPPGSPISVDGEIIGHVVSHDRSGGMAVCSSVAVAQLVDQSFEPRASVSNDIRLQERGHALDQRLQRTTKPIVLLEVSGGGKTDIIQYALALARKRGTRTVYFQPYKAMSDRVMRKLLEELQRVCGGPPFTRDSVAAELRSRLHGSAPLVLAIDDYDYLYSATRHDLSSLIQELAGLVDGTSFSFVVAIESSAVVKLLAFDVDVMDLGCANREDLQRWAERSNVKLSPDALTSLVEVFTTPTLQEIAVDALSSGFIRNVKELVENPRLSPLIGDHVAQLTRDISDEGLSVALAEVIAGRSSEVEERELKRLEGLGVISRLDFQPRLRTRLYELLVSHNGPWTKIEVGRSGALVASLRRESRRWYQLGLEVRLLPRSRAKSVLFKLHSSFQVPERRIAVVDRVARLEEWTYGTFTVRASIEGDPTELALNLATISGVPTEFLTDGELSEAELERLHTYPTRASQYYNPPSEISRIGRPLQATSFVRAIA